MKNITVIGAGTMGNGIAHTFAQKGFNVNLVDISADALEKAINTIKGNLNRMVQKEKITEEQVSSIIEYLYAEGFILDRRTTYKVVQNFDEI